MTDLRQQLEEAINQSFSDAEEIARLSAELDSAQQENARGLKAAQPECIAALPQGVKEVCITLRLLHLPSHAVICSLTATGFLKMEALVVLFVCCSLTQLHSCGSRQRALQCHCPGLKQWSMRLSLHGWPSHHVLHRTFDICLSAG